MLSNELHKHRLINPFDPFFNQFEKADQQNSEQINFEKDQREFSEFAAKELLRLKNDADVNRGIQEMRELMAEDISEALFRFSRLVRL